MPAAQQKALQLIDLAKQQGLDVQFWEGWRDPAVELTNIAAGTSKLKDPIDSLHTWGVAFDIVFRNSAGLPIWPSDTDPRWRQLAQLGQSIGLFSGGLNWGWDWPHFQLPEYPLSGLKQQYGRDYLAFVQDNAGQVA